MISSLHSRLQRSIVEPAAGMGLVELMVAAVIIAVVAVMLVLTTTSTYNGTRQQQDRVFAFQVAESIQAEIAALATKEEVVGQNLIDALDDGGISQPTLTTTQESGVLVPPDDPLSGNYQRSGHWLWARRIEVRPLSSTGNRNLRYVTVRVLKRGVSGREHEVASLSSLVNAATEARPTTEVLDAYFIAIENVPGCWIHLEEMRPFVMGMVGRIEEQNPGLELRTHWITKLGYGRDRVYRPYVNETVDSTQNVPYGYVYPGLMPQPNASTYQFVPSLMAGRLVTETGEHNGYDQTTNPYPYAFADRFNHAMRYPAALAFHNARLGAIQARRAEIEAALGTGFVPPAEYDDMSEEPTLRLFLEDLCTSPDRYRHALIFNLHGELLPLPPLRNYSDAAKEPVGLPDVRVVLHPEQLRTPRPPSGGEDVRLRLYAYVTDPDAYGGPAVMPASRPIAVQVMDLDLTDGAGGLWSGVRIESLRGGVPVGGDSGYYPMSVAKPAGDPTLLGSEMYYDAVFVDPGASTRKYTLIKLYQTPVVAPPVAKDGQVRGLFQDERSRLYGLEYVPSCPGPTADFSHDLYAAGAGPKNTARWVITIPQQVFADRRWVTTASPPVYFDPTGTATPDRVLTVRTRLWDPTLADPLTAGTWPGGAEARVVEPENVSETYTWWSASADAVPMTERFQYQGDPRHNPYKDLLSGASDFPDGYNRFFDSLQNGGEDATADFLGLDPALLTNRWSGACRQDVPRFLQLLREGVVRSHAFYCNVAGLAHEYLAFGGEVGDDAHGEYPNGIPIDLTPFGTPGSSGYIDTFVQGSRYLRSAQTDYWWGMPWLGELFPDEAYSAQWIGLDANGDVSGNLHAGTATTEFFQATGRAVYAGSGFTAFGTGMFESTQIAGGRGLSSFLNAGTATSGYSQVTTTADGTLQSTGDQIARNYNPRIPTRIVIDQPLDPAGTGPFAEEWLQPPYATGRFGVSPLFTLYDATSPLVGSQVVAVSDPAGTSRGFVLLHGGDNAPAAAEDVTATALLGMVHSYLESADPSRPYPNPVVPRTVGRYPTETSVVSDPSSVDVRWEIEWRRWDALPYTESAPSGYSRPESTLEYVLLYSSDGGVSWRYVQDESLARPGIRPTTSTHLIADAGEGPETYPWSTPAASYPAGTYLLRVESYCVGASLHFSYHETRFELDR